MDKGYETEEERQDRYRKKVLDELNNSDIRSEFGKDVQAFGQTKKKSAVNFNRNNDSLKANSDIIVGDSEATVDNKNSKGSKFLLIICAIFIIVAVAFFPTISKKVSELKNNKKRPSVEVKKPEEKVYEKLTLESEETSKLKYPIMHIDISNKNTYYSKDKVTISDFSNNDILYNALADVYEGNMGAYTGSYNGKYCGAPTNQVAIDARYLRLRIDNLYTDNTKYTLSDFVVPVNNTGSKYIGTWKYDSNTSKYIYYGDCTNTKSANVVYYDIKVPYEATSSDKNIELYVYNYIAFAMVNKTNNSYIIYKDTNYSEELTRGTLKTTNYETELTSIVNNYSKDSLNKYKYTFSIVDCAYQDYCFISGEWVK